MGEAYIIFQACLKYNIFKISRWRLITYTQD